ncbi:MAG: hypothetical protein CMJ49_09805 [Planctomycetaceae bacterium]|nr:hypothetical protein [Planctomycetaceae bacterium]
MTDFANLIHDHGPIVWATACRLLGNDADAADCFQDTFVEAVRVSRRQTIQHWPGLLRRIATVRALDQLRRVRHRDRVDPAQDLDLLPGAQSDPVGESQSHELAAALRQAVARLPDRQAEVFCLRCLDELSYKEIADQLDLTENAVGVLLHKARTKLAANLDRHLPEPVGPANP